MDRKVLIVGGAVGIALALGTGGTALGIAATRTTTSPATPDSAACATSAPKLTVQGTGMATGTPDLLTVSVGIDVTDSSAQASLADDNSKATAVTAALQQGGILDKDVQTSNLSINPHYNISGAITGYEVTNTLTANLHNFTTAGAVIDALASAAGNAVRVNSLTFSMQDPRGMEDQARTDAVHQAVSHAKSMAEAAGDRLGPVCSLSDQTPTGYVSPDLNSQGAYASASAANVPLEAGTQQASAQVTIVYGLERPTARQ